RIPIRRWLKRRPPQKDQPARDLRCHGTCDLQPDVTEATGNEIPGILAPRRRRDARRSRNGLQSKYKAIVAAQRDLILAIWMQDFARNKSGRCAGKRIRIYKATPQFRMLVSDDACRAPQRSLFNRYTVTPFISNGLCVLCHEPKPQTGTFTGENRLQ